MNIVSRESLAAQFQADRLAGKAMNVMDPVELVATGFGGKAPKSGSILDSNSLGIIDSRKAVSRDLDLILKGSAKSGFDIKQFKGNKSIMQMIKKGEFAGTANSLNDNWTNLMDALRFDLTLKKEARPTVRQFLYNVADMPDATKDVRPTELFPYGIVFEENNGEGQAVRAGGNLGGQHDTIAMKIYAAMFTWTLLARLFDGSNDIRRLNDGVALGYSAKQDDLAISPILADVYSTVGTTKWTAASTQGDNRQEYLWNTIYNAINALCARKDPVTKRLITAQDLVLLCSSQDARAFELINGLPSDRNRNYPNIPGLSGIVAYDGEVINMPNETITYAGCTTGIGYIVKKNRYMTIIKKTGLVTEIDETPNVSNLSQKEQAWYFSEGIYNSVGINNFVQKVTLPWAV